MSTSEAAVQVAPSYGENQVPDVAVQALFVTTLLPLRLRTTSLIPVKSAGLVTKGIGDSAYRVLQVPLIVDQVGNKLQS